MKLLHCTANVNSAAPLDIEGAFGRIRSRLEAVSSRWLLRPVADLTLDDLATEIAGSPPPNILHFDGHGTPDGLLLKSPGDSPIEARHAGLVEMLAPHGDTLWLVVLLSCHSAKLAENLANRLGAAIGIDGEILDIVASPFAPIFYMHLSVGRSLEAAFDTARGRLRAQFSDADCDRLHLFTSNPDKRFDSPPPEHLEIMIETLSDHRAVLRTRTPNATPIEVEVEGRGRQSLTPDSLVSLTIERGQITLRIHASLTSEFVGRPAIVIFDGGRSPISSLQPLPDQHLGSDEDPCILDLRFERTI